MRAQRETPDPDRVAAAAARAAERTDRVDFPDPKSGPPQQIWSAYFKTHTPSAAAVQREAIRLHRHKQHEQVIAMLQGALINGQSQPWMYEVLALSMEIAGRPKADVERVLLSLADFGAASFDNTTYSAAYLTRFGRDARALELYQQASRMQPERPEPYLLGLNLARGLEDPAGIVWAASGIVQHVWSDDFEQEHRRAKDAVLTALQQLRRQGTAEQAEQLEQQFQQSLQRDLQITLTWSGEADVDLIVEEPNGTTCSFEQPQTAGGGLWLREGYGPNPENTREEYVCVRGFPGEYVIRVRLQSGRVVAGRAKLTIIQHAGTPEAKKLDRSVVIGDKDSIVRVTLGDGRRKQPRNAVPDATVSLEHLRERVQRRMAGRRAPLSERGASVVRSGDSPIPFGPQPAGALTFTPQIRTIFDGATITARPVVSPDRRYVRFGINQTFSELLSIETFSFINSGNP